MTPVSTWMQRHIDLHARFHAYRRWWSLAFLVLGVGSMICRMQGWPRTAMAIGFIPLGCILIVGGGLLLLGLVVRSDWHAAWFRWSGITAACLRAGRQVGEARLRLAGRWLGMLAVPPLISAGIIIALGGIHIPPGLRIPVLITIILYAMAMLVVLALPWCLTADDYQAIARRWLVPHSGRWPIQIARLGIDHPHADIRLAAQSRGTALQSTMDAGGVACHLIDNEGSSQMTDALATGPTPPRSASR